MSVAGGREKEDPRLLGCFVHYQSAAIHSVVLHLFFAFEVKMITTALKCDLYQHILTIVENGASFS